MPARHHRARSFLYANGVIHPSPGSVSLASVAWLSRNNKILYPNRGTIISQRTSSIFLTVRDLEGANRSFEIGRTDPSSSPCRVPTGRVPDGIATRQTQSAACESTRECIHRKLTVPKSAGVSPERSTVMIDGNSIRREAESIYRERVLRARAIPSDLKLIDGFRLFERACGLMRDGIRDQFPNSTPEEVDLSPVCVGPPVGK